MNFSIFFVRLIVSLILIRPSVCINMQRNYRYFFLFVTSSALLCIFIFAMSALHLKYQIDYYGNVWKAIKESPASVILMAYCFFFLWFVGGLACFHLYLISTNQVSFAFIACTIFLQSSALFWQLVIRELDLQLSFPFIYFQMQIMWLANFLKRYYRYSH